MDLSERPSGDFLRHPWEVARAEFFAGELERAGLLAGGVGGAGRRVLDVGSGDAWFASELVQRAPSIGITCWDLGYEERLPEPRAGIEFTATAPQGKFDVCLMLDVAEHVEDDKTFLKTILEHVNPSGHVLFSVPAWQSLYTKHDKALRHYRRYNPEDARALLSGAGLEVVRSGGLFHSLLFPRALSKFLEKNDGEVTPPDDLAWRGGRLLRDVVLGALWADRLLTRASAAVDLDVPGLSWWALCRKP